MTDGIFKNEHGYLAYGHNGIEYSILEGVTMGDKVATSDMAFIVLDSYDDILCQCITFTFGANELKEGDKIAWIDKDLDIWEQSHPDIVKMIKEGKVGKI